MAITLAQYKKHTNIKGDNYNLHFINQVLISFKVGDGVLLLAQPLLILNF